VKSRPYQPVAPRARLKTYSHLAAARRVPTEYEIGSTRLLYHPERGLEVQLPFGQWYARHGAEVTWPGVDWDAFADPRRLTYSAYTEARAEDEGFVAQLFARLDEAPRPTPAARACFDEEVAPLRFALHGLQMAIAYLGQLAPAGRITIVCALQAADELRRIQHIAYRMGQLRQGQDAPAGDDSRGRWQDGPEWQPLRRLIEELLVTWDWGTALAALQLAVKPALDDYVAGALAERVRATGDHLFAEVLAASRGDARWSREWTEALAATIAAAQPDGAAGLATAAALAATAAPWQAAARAAVTTLEEAQCR
jgi:toluene monooxygenase system protein E